MMKQQDITLVGDIRCTGEFCTKNPDFQGVKVTVWCGTSQIVFNCEFPVASALVIMEMLI